ncbi:uncharacterized protein EI90DRAFT_3296623, partial [Cantharellus anzutake]|uniref:uncharacterized protein n=1 Tax=Cantharellus anzutake TaxID=1750568 RepID=UPI001905B198
MPVRTPRCCLNEAPRAQIKRSKIMYKRGSKTYGCPSHRRPPFSHYFNYNSFCFASSEFRHMLDTPLIIDWSTDVDVTQTGKVMDVQAMQLGWSDANVAEHTTDTGGGVNTMLTSIKHSRGFQPKARNQLICRLMFHVCKSSHPGCCHLGVISSLKTLLRQNLTDTTHRMLVAPNACMSSLSFEPVLIWSTHISPITVMATLTVKMTMIRMM